MMPTLDVHPTTVAFAQKLVREGAFVFCAQGDPAIGLPLIEGMAWVRKNVGPTWDVQHYAINGAEYTVVTFTIADFSSELGIQQWGLVHFNADAEGILAKWPGPIARKIMGPGVTLGTAKHLKQWYRDAQYHPDGTLLWELKEPVI